MNYKFKKKPVVIEAFQMTKDRRQDNSEWPCWLHVAWNKDGKEKGAVSSEDWPHSNGKDRLVIQTLEGMHTVGWGDYIIEGVHGELYPCKPDIFRKTYENPEEQISKCVVCGGNVEVVGKTTKNYRNLDLEKIEKLESENKKLKRRPSSKDFKEYRYDQLQETITKVAGWSNFLYQVKKAIK